MVNPLDAAIAYIAPRWAVKRKQARMMLRAYEAAKPSRTRKKRGDAESGSAAAGRATVALRQQARDLEQNYDIASGVLDRLVDGVVGTGITSEPMIRNVNGQLMTDLNKEVSEISAKWEREPETTGELCWSDAQRLVARSFLRDGEIFSQFLLGRGGGVRHGSEIPFSLELLEADFVPIYASALRNTAPYGIERDAWGRARFYHVYKSHPGDTFTVGMETKRIPAVRMNHLKLVRRVRQSRGVSIFAPTMVRIDGIRDMEESEIVAARMAAAMGFAIKKSVDTSLVDVGDGQERVFDFRPGMVWDQTMPGEEIQALNLERPNNEIPSFIKSQLQAVSAGTGAAYSSIARDYKGSYSSQRQELVEVWRHYSVLTDHFTGRYVVPVYEKRTDMLFAVSGRYTFAELERSGVNLTTLLDAEHLGPVMPWVDPQREVTAIEKFIQLKLNSRSQVIRARGGNPRSTWEQIAEEENQIGPELGIDLAAAPSGNNAPAMTEEQAA